MGGKKGGREECDGNGLEQLDFNRGHGRRRGF